MGAVSRIAVTGAAGFVGRAVVAEARARGLDILALVRGEAPPEWASDPGITVLRCDLAAAGPEVARALEDAQAVIHAAAHVGGEAAQHDRDTLAATTTLLTAMEGAGVRRLVLVSSIMVYDVRAAAVGPDGMLQVTEITPLAEPDQAADSYAAAKIRQERHVRDWAERPGHGAWLMRAGAIYGPGRLWNAHLGIGLGPILVALGTRGDLPLVHLGRAAHALVEAATTDLSGAQPFNLLDDDLPDRTRVIAAMRRGGWPKVTLPLPWPILVPLTRLAAPWRSRPGLLHERTLRARMTPLRYPNDALRSAFADRDRGSFEDRISDGHAGGSR